MATQEFLQKICDDQGWELANFFALDGDRLTSKGQPFVVKNPALTSFQHKSLEVTFEEGKGLVGRVWAGGEHEWCMDVRTLDPTKYKRQGIAKDCGVSTCVGVPFYKGGNFVGVAEFFSTQTKPEDEALGKQLEALCKQ